jgi:hypothetical protein
LVSEELRKVYLHSMCDLPTTPAVPMDESSLHFTPLQQLRIGQAWLNPSWR